MGRIGGNAGESEEIEKLGEMCVHGRKHRRGGRKFEMKKAGRFRAYQAALPPQDNGLPNVCTTLCK
jgi:hypothetical protein